jgi:tetratricopeptide (TPR) repeat protein
MDKQKLYETLENNGQLAAVDLESLAHHYPYFTTVQHLLSKEYNEQRDHRFAGQMQRSAIAASSRKALRNYLLHTTRRTPETPTEREIEIVSLKFRAEEVNEIAEVPAPFIVDLTQEEIPDSIGSLVDQMIEEQPAAIITEEIWNIDWRETQEKEIIEEQEATTLEEKEPEPLVRAVEVYDSMDLNIISEAVNSSIQIEVSQTDDEKEDLPEATDEFAKWLWRKSQNKQSEESEEVEEQSSRESHWKEIDIAELFPSKPAADSQQKEHQRNLIDRFIRTEPRIVPGKVSEYESGNLAKDSLEEDPNLVSETMAQLFVRQGRIDKAKKIYKKLMALYPEKSIYFAAQLKNLDKTKKG